jgi:hypothetical protein
MHESYRVADGLAAGMTPASIRAAHAPYWGIRSRDAVVDTVSRALAFMPRMPENGFYYGVTAAILQGLPVPAHLVTDELHIGVPAGTRRPDARGIVAHHIRIEPLDIAVDGSLVLTSVARTWVDLAAVGLSIPQLVAAGDRALWVRRPLSTDELLADAVARYDGRRGARRMRDAFALLDGRADSPPESEIRAHIVLAGLPRPEVNVPVDVARARIRPDMTWRRYRTFLEYEGDHHRTDKGQWRYDIRRYDAALGDRWNVVRATGDDYRDPKDLIARLRRLLS